MLFRSDGYHNLDTVFYPIEYFDVLEAIHSSKQSEPFHFKTTGKIIEGDANKNLCIKAFQLLKNHFPKIPPIDIHLHKEIPMGAGMGGGSSDGAFMLKLLNEKFNLGIDEQLMMDFALQLGSDCPIFIKNKPCYALGRGELLEEVDLNLSNYYLLIVSPGIHISTAEAFNGIQPNHAISSCKDVIQLPIENWREQLFNDFEKTVFASHPVLKSIKDEVYLMGAIYASMTGTGSTIYGLFKTLPEFDGKFDATYEVRVIKPKMQA